MDENEVKEQKDVNTPSGQENTPQGEKNDELAEYKTSDGEFDVEKIKKVIADRRYYRQQISKLKQLPEKLEEYGKDFTFDSKFDEFLSDEEHRKTVGDLLTRIDNMCLEKGIGVERNHDIRRFVLNELADKKVFDLTSAEERKAREEKIIADRDDAVQNSIGDVSDIRQWDKNLYSWLKSFCNNDAEFALHQNLAKTNATWALSLNKVRQAMLGNRIPVVAPEASYNEEQWFNVFTKASKEEQDKLLKERAEKLTKYK